MKPVVKFTVLFRKTHFPLLWFLSQAFFKLGLKAKRRLCSPFPESISYIWDEVMCAFDHMCLCVCAHICDSHSTRQLGLQARHCQRRSKIEIGKFCFSFTVGLKFKKMTSPPNPYSKKNPQQYFLMFLLVALTLPCVKHSCHWLQFPWSLNMSIRAWTLFWATQKWHFKLQMRTNKGLHVHFPNPVI